MAKGLVAIVCCAALISCASTNRIGLAYQRTPPAHYLMTPTAPGRYQGVTPTPRAQRPSDQVSVVFNALSRCGAKISERERWRIAATIHDESHRYGYDPLFVLAMVEVESTCKPSARSRRGAVGLIQMKPSTARAVARDAGLPWHGAKTLTMPGVNIQLALRYLSALEEQFQDPDLAVAAYHSGPQRVARMSRRHARRLPYLQKILLRYEHLLQERGSVGTRIEVGNFRPQWSAQR